TLSRIISSMQERFGRRIFFVDDKGNILVSGQGAGAHFGSLHDWPGLAQIAPQILNHQSQPTQLLYQRDGQSVVVSSRYIPELKWHLIVEQDEAPEFLPLQRVFWLNLLVSAAITLLVMWVILYTVNRFRRRLEEMAATDSLTRLLNRQAFGFVFEQAVHESGRSH